MSIAYGHFSSALQASAATGLVNGVATLYFTVPWYPASYIDRIRIYNSSGSTKNISNIGIVNNAAHVRAGGNEILDDYVYYDLNSYSVNTASNNSAYYAINPAIYFEEGYSRPYVYLKVVLAANATNDFYYCTITGRKAYPSSYETADKTHIEVNKNYSVILMKKTASGLGNTISDVTKAAIGNAVNVDNTSEFNIDDARDYVYVGSTNFVDHWEFQVGTASTNAGALSAEIWNGSAWKGISLLDNTSSDGSGSLRFSGVVEGAGLATSTWVPTKLDAALSASLPTDPATTFENKIKAGTTFPIGMFNNPARLWVRFTVASIGDKAVFKGILPVHETYG